MRRPSVRIVTAVLAMLVMLVQGTWVLAGTTGGIAGNVTDVTTGKAVVGAKVSVASPSQNVTTTTDPQGRYGFLSLAPDTYTVTVVAAGYQPFSYPGVTVIADQTQTYNFTPNKTIQEIGRTRSRSASDLVKPGQTADVYSISGQLSENSQSLSGGGALFQTFAALSGVPGVYVPQGANFGQNNAAPFIRGGDYNQVGFEYDGIPVNRAFDNYVSNTQGITGQQELQVYTGGVPASSAGVGLSGYVNQVIKSGTYPATANTEGVLGTPTFYHYLRGEYGGASPSRAVSYYIGATGWNQSYRYGNQSNGGQGINDLVSFYVPTLDGTGSQFAIPFNAGGNAYQLARETVGNIHIGLAHKNGDGGRDDIQLLGSVGRDKFYAYNSLNDLGGCAGPFNSVENGLASCNDATVYLGGVKTVYNGPINSGFNPNLLKQYRFPSASGSIESTGLIDPNYRGSEDNNNGLFKAQFQKNFGSSAYLRVYGYTNFSTWQLYDPVGFFYTPTPVGTQDYELTTHTRGVALELADQINAKNLLQGSFSYTYASVLRANNSTAYNSSSSRGRVQLRDANQFCYSPTTGLPADCYNGSSAGNVQLVGGYRFDQLPAGGVAPIIGTAAANGAQYQVVNSGYAVTYNTVAPKFTALSLSDSFQVSDKFKLDFGARYNRYIYSLADTSQQALVGGSNTANFVAYNNEHCFDPLTNKVSHRTAGTACAAGLQAVSLSNTYNGNVDSSTFEPRFSGSYAMTPYDVLRFSAGKYSQPINSAYVQYNRAGDLPAYTENNFFLYGFTTPRHDARPQVSSNYDFSYEKRLKNAPLSFSFTPFYRTTKDQSQSFYLDPRANFVSGLNVGTLRAFGYELLTRFGDFNRDGMSAQVSFAYTNSKIKYQNFSGSNRNIIDNINQSLTGSNNLYNSYTAAGGGSPCYNPTNGIGSGLVGGGCPAGTYGNPYFNSPMITTPFDRNGYSSPYDLTPSASNGAALGGSSSYEVPFATTVIVQYRKNGWRIVPTAQYDSGFRYGSPYAWTGYDPASCAPAASTPDVAGCGIVFRPNPYTGRFDNLGEFKQPGTLSLNLQVAKDLSKRVTVTGIFANLYRHCFTRGYAWEQAGNNACAYALNADMNGTNAGFYYGTFVGNGNNTNVQRIQRDPFGYAPAGAPNPFQAFVSVQVKM